MSRPASAPRLFKERLRSQYPVLTAAQVKVADFLLADPNSGLFLTVEQLSQKVGVSPATIVRFAIRLGYRGFTEMQQELRGHAKDSLQPVERLVHPLRDRANVIRNSLLRDEANLRELMASVDEEAVRNLAKSISAADRVFLVGGRSSHSIALFAGIVLQQIRSGVHVLRSSEDEAPEFVSTVAPGDLLVAISLPRYSSSTIRIGKFFHSRNASVTVITDSIRSPLAPLCENVLTVPIRSESFFNSNVAAFSLVNALVSFVALDRREATRKSLEQIESVWQYFGIHAMAD